jgi:hypothetical protein
MAAARGVPALLGSLAILLSACGYGLGAAGGGPHSVSWQRGFQAGREARRHYFRPGSHEHNLILYCAEKAYLDVQPLKSSLLEWTEGFNTGCGSRLHPRPRPSGTLAPKLLSARPRALAGCR